jgi:hypothetical protein
MNDFSMDGWIDIVSGWMDWREIDWEMKAEPTRKTTHVLTPFV